MTDEPTPGSPGGKSSFLGDRYRLIRPIGSGGMAVVWEARDEVLGRTVAVKVLAGRHVGDPQSRELIRHEARAAAALSHPNIAQVYDYGETATTSGTFPYVVMELIRGDTLQTRAAAAPVTPRFAMQVCAEVAAALAAAHAEGIVHRDVKPANVMLAGTGAKVVDFGIAAAVAPGNNGEDDFEVLGTPAYLAPERLISDVVEPASDVYALAILLYQLLAGCLPWSSDTTTQMLTAHIWVDPEPLPPTAGVPGYVVDLCNRCLAKDPTLRPSARELAAVLTKAAQSAPSPADRLLDLPLPAAGSVGAGSLAAGSAAAGQLATDSAAPDSAAAGQLAERPLADSAATGLAGPRATVAGSAAAGSLAAGSATAGSLAADSAGTGSTVAGSAAEGPAAGSAATGLAAPRSTAADSAAAGATVERSTVAGSRAAGSAGGGSALTGSAAGGSAAAGSAAAGPSPDFNSIDEIQGHAGPVDNHAPAAAQPGQATGPTSRRFPVRRWAAAATAAAVIVAVVWALWPNNGRRDAAAAGAAVVGANAVRSQAAAPGTSPSVARSPASPGPAGRAGVTPVVTERPTRSTATSTPTATGQPTRSAAPTTSPPPTGDPTTVYKLTSDGGTVKATCPAPSTAKIRSAKPIKPMKLLSVDTTPGPDPAAVFKKGKVRITMTVTCQGGVPSSTNTVTG